ncbi:MAG: cell shape determination protein CcmA [Erythrobacter sp.]|nr:cell shape determination protein CcmA [Erythrobacter sp.]
MAQAQSPTFSVIGSDVTIKGDVAASADLHVDGKVEGDISCASLVQGEASHIIGGIEAQKARLAGHVTGSIRARELVILRTAHIEGDVQYDALTIEQGAQVEGRFALGGAPAQAQSQARPAQPTPGARPETAGSRPAAPDEPKLSIAG